MGNNNSRDTPEGIKECSKLVHDEVIDYPVTIFTRGNDPASEQALDMVLKEGLRVKEKDLNLIYHDNQNLAKDYWNGLIHETGSNHVPHIFVCGQYVGGVRELRKMVEEKKLLGAVRECWMQYDNHPLAKEINK